MGRVCGICRTEYGDAVPVCCGRMTQLLPVARLQTQPLGNARVYAHWTLSCRYAVYGSPEFPRAAHEECSGWVRHAVHCECPCHERAGGVVPEGRRR